MPEMTYKLIDEFRKEVGGKLDKMEANFRQDLRDVREEVVEIKTDFRTMEAGRLTRLENTVAGLQAGIEQAAKYSSGGTSTSGIFNKDKLIEMSLRAVIWALAIAGAVVGLKFTL